MSNRNVENKHSELTEYVASKWEKSGQNQAKFIEALLGGPEAAAKFGKQTLSKFIHGRLAEPPEGLIEALARTYSDRSVEQLTAMAARSPRSKEARSIPAEDDVPMTFLVGHTIWGATFVAAMLDPSGPLDVKFASFACSEDDDVPGEPEWVWSRSMPSPDCIPGPGQAPTITPLSAPDVIRLMKEIDDEDRVVFGIVPGELLRDWNDSHGRFVKVASLMDAAAACVIIVPNDAELGPDAVSSHEVAEWLERKCSDHPRVVVLAETGTVAAERAKRVTSMAAMSAKRHRGTQFTSDHISTRELRNLSWNQVQKHHPNAVAMVAWEPQASWFVNNSAAQVKRIPLLHVPEQLTFDIYLFIPTERASSDTWHEWRLRVGKAVRRLFREILPTIQAKEELVSRLFSVNPEGDLERLSDYFGLSPSNPEAAAAHHLSRQEIEEIFSSIRFATSADALGMKSAWLWS